MMGADRKFSLRRLLNKILPPLEGNDRAFYNVLLDGLRSEAVDNSVLSELEIFDIAEDFVGERWLREMQAALVQNSAAEAAEKLLPTARIGKAEPILHALTLAEIGIDNAHVRALAVLAAQEKLQTIDEMIAELTARRSKNLRALTERNQPADSSSDKRPSRVVPITRKPKESHGN